MNLVERLNWTRNRLAAASPAEVFSRVGDLYRHLALYASEGAVKRRSARRKDRPAEVPELDGQLADIGQQEIAPLLEEADRWFKHEASFLSLQNVPLGDKIDWHRDYSSGTVAPSSYSLFLNHRDSSVVGDVKHLWELNRLQQLPVLAAAAVVTGQQAYVDEISDQLNSWVEQNPFMRGPNWKSPLEAGLRLLSFAFISFILGRSRSERLFSRKIEESIYQHQYFIRRFHSRHSSANNHLIGEMAGLYAGAVTWPLFAESNKWRLYAREKLIEQIKEQIEPDGVGKERAIEYQVFVAELFLTAAALGQAAGEPYPAPYLERLARMAGFLNALRDRSSNLPMFGDGDSGQVLWLANNFADRIEALYRLLSGGKSSLLRDLILTFGQTVTLPLPEAEPSGRFEQGGYYVLADRQGEAREVMMVVDAGPLGLPPMNAHGHADALSFWLTAGGREFLIDPGTFCYGNSPHWRSYFRSTAAHNTVRLDGEDQSVQAGTFLWRQAANCETRSFIEHPAYFEIEASHDGYARLSDPVTHVRKIRLFRGAGKVLIVDRLACGGPHHVELFFHFSPSCDVRPESDNEFAARNGDQRLSLRILGSNVASQLFKGSEKPLTGWVSPRFGLRIPSCTVVAKANINGSAEFTTEITVE
jgi:hypothetical protein